MIARRPFGRTGHDSSRIIFGAAALGSMSQSRAEATLALVEEHGINHIDTAASYGESELRLAPWLRSHRSSVFLATKTGQRRGPEARAELERSLERLGVDQIDLIQLHNLVEPEEFEVAHGHGGAVEALAKARDEGLVRYIGVTGHGTRIAAMHLQSLARFHFDSVLLPYNFSMYTYGSYQRDFDELAARCLKDNVALQTIKSLARRRWAHDDSSPRRSWYEPLREPDLIEKAVHWVLSDDRVFLNTTSDATLLPLIFAAAQQESFTRPSLSTMEADALAHSIRPLFDGEALERI